MRLQTAAAGGGEKQEVEPGQHERVLREGIDGGRGAERDARREDQEEKSTGSTAKGGGTKMGLEPSPTLAHREEKVADVPRALMR